MANSIQTEDLRHALIIAGIKEIERHGLADFSLRRVASECGVSCAAPYRHFKSREDLISAIISYINDQWGYLESQILEVYSHDPRRMIVELCVSGVRFWIANPNFRSIMMTDRVSPESRQNRMSESIKALIKNFCDSKGIKKEEADLISLSVSCTVYGTAQMIGSRELPNAPDTIDSVRSIIERSLPQ